MAQTLNPWRRAVPGALNWGRRSVLIDSRLFIWKRGSAFSLGYLRRAQPGAPCINGWCRGGCAKLSIDIDKLAS